MSQEKPVSKVVLITERALLSKKSILTLEELISIVFGLKWSYLEKILTLDSENLPPDTSSAHLSAAKAARELQDWVIDESEEWVSTLNFDNKGEPSDFYAHEIGRLFDNKNIIGWLSKRGVHVSLITKGLIEYLMYGSPGYDPENDNVDWEHYANLSRWTIEITIMVLSARNPGKENHIREQLSLAGSGDDPISLLFRKACILDKERKVVYFRPSEICSWAFGIGYFLPRSLSKALLQKEIYKEKFDAAVKSIKLKKEKERTRTQGETKPVEQEPSVFPTEQSTSSSQAKWQAKQETELSSQEEVKSAKETKKQKAKKPKSGSTGGKPSPKKEDVVKRLRKIVKKGEFKKLHKGIFNKDIPYAQPVLEEFIEDPSVNIDEELIEKIQNDDDYFEEIFGTNRSNLTDRWIPEARK